MPQVNNYNTTLGVPKTRGPHGGMQFAEECSVFAERNLKITGITKDATGSAIGNCAIILFDKQNDIGGRQGYSDANGNYSIDIPKGLSQTQTTTWYIVAYKAGATSVTGGTVDTLTGA